MMFGNKRNFGKFHIPDLKGNRVVQAACGVFHICLVLEDGSVRLFGNNDEGQCNTYDIDISLEGRRVVQATCAMIHTCLVLDDGSVRVFGGNTYDEFVLPDLKGCRVIQASFGMDHLCLVLDDYSVRLSGSD